MSSNPAEISNIIKEQIKNYKSRIEMKETGSVILVGDGIARVYGLRSCMSGELLEFDVEEEDCDCEDCEDEE